MTAETSTAAAPARPARSLAGVVPPPRQRRPGEYAAWVSRARARTGADLAVIHLVTRAGTGDERAWDALVERYAPLIWPVCRRYRPSGADVVGQSVWVHLAGHLDHLRDPAALPGWLATTIRRERGRVLCSTGGPDAAGYVPEAEMLPDQRAATADQDLLEAGRHAALREAFAALPPAGQQLIAMLTADPPVPYTGISARLGVPVGSIGPTRRRCLENCAAIRPWPP
jgi:RNA polymerase sigma factor (sigma-70 family)